MAQYPINLQPNQDVSQHSGMGLSSEYATTLVLIKFNTFLLWEELKKDIFGPFQCNWFGTLLNVVFFQNTVQYNVQKILKTVTSPESH